MGPGAKVSQHMEGPRRGQAALQTQQLWGCKQLLSLAGMVGLLVGSRLVPLGM